MTDNRSFHVHPRQDGASHRVQADSFEDAALAFVENWSAAFDQDGDVAVIVTDDITGRVQCFRIDLLNGEAEPCA